LGIIVGKNSIKIDPDKIIVIKDWEISFSVKNVKEFLNFANFYRRFIRDYLKVVKLFTDLTKKGMKFI
jgi:hypothetical protein